MSDYPAYEPEMSLAPPRKSGMIRVREWPVVLPGWQPIDSAPLNGTGILMWTDTGGCHVAYWNGAAWFTDSGLVLSDDCHGKPTHWMPRPPPPLYASTPPNGFR